MLIVLLQLRSTGEEDESEDGATYQLDMMRCLREVNVDNNTVGWCAPSPPRVAGMRCSFCALHAMRR